MMDEIKLNLENFSPIRDGRSRQSKSVDIERNLPPVIHQRTERESNFTRNLRPHVKRVIGLLPFL